MLKVYIGYDHREDAAYRVSVYSLLANVVRKKVSVTPLNIRNLQQCGLLDRPVELRNGKLWDIISDAPQSTEFAIARFATPILAQTGWALFADCDTVFLDDVNKIMDVADDRYAVMCVKHAPDLHTQSVKMDGQLQTRYPRKNWSSVMLFNCDHPANRRLTVGHLNDMPGRDLHRFFWLHDNEIGELAQEWNWLVNVHEMAPSRPKIAHFTLGGPWLPDWKTVAHDSLWLHYQRNMRIHDEASAKAGNGMSHVRASEEDTSRDAAQEA